MIWLKRLMQWSYGIYRWLIGSPWHCWQGKRDWLESQGDSSSQEWCETWNCDSTCFRLNGHFGPHEWIPDNELVVSFPASSSISKD